MPEQKPDLEWYAQLLAAAQVGRDSALCRVAELEQRIGDLESKNLKLRETVAGLNAEITKLRSVDSNIVAFESNEQ